MRVLHFGNMANVAVELAKAQRSLGHEVRVIAFRQDMFKEGADEQFTGMGPIGWNVAARRASRDWPTYDILHIHGGIWRSQIYYRLLRRSMGSAAWVVHLHGSETRGGKGLHHLDLADALVVSTVDLTAYVPTAEWLPNPVEVPHRMTPLPGADRIVFGHFPTNREMKGTEAILRAFARAFGRPRSEGPLPGSPGRLVWDPVELVVGEKLPRARVLDLMDGCDAVVDHLSNIGPVSLVALEAMARGRAAVSSFDAARYPAGCPVLRITPSNAVERLLEIAANRETLRRAGEAGREYVEDVHDPTKVATRTIEIYERARGSRILGAGGR